MMTDDVERLLREAEADLDRLICESAREAVQIYLDAGATVHQLPQLMQPFVSWWRQHRAEAIAKMHAAAERIGATMH